MSDRLLSQLADRLGLDESDVAPMLNALLKQVRQRAGQGSGARIPTLGTFTTTASGTLQFEPDADLVDTVNEDFAGLEDEPAPTPKRAPDTSTALAEAPPAASPKQAPADQSSAPSASGDASQTGAPTEDDDATEELPASGPTATKSSDTGSLWPSEANTATSPGTTETDIDDKTDDDFWSRDREWDLSSVAFGDVADDDREPDDAAPSAMPSDEESPPAADSEDREEASPSADVPPEQGATDESPTQRSGLRTAVGVVVVLAALIGGWIVLGAQGTVPSPGSVIENVRASFSGGTEPPAVTPSDSDPSAASDASPPASDSSPPDPADSAASNQSPANESADDAPTDDDDSSSTEAPVADDAPATSPIVPEEGGWTLVVASRTSEQEAEAIRTQFATALQSVGVPVDVLASEGSGGTTRYRVIVGQVSSQEEARRIQQEYSELVPDDAWPLRL